MLDGVEEGDHIVLHPSDLTADGVLVARAERLVEMRAVQGRRVKEDHESDPTLAVLRLIPSSNASLTTTFSSV